VGLELLQNQAQPALIVGQCLVQQFLAGPVKGDGVMIALTDVQADKHINGVVVVDHAAPPVAAVPVLVLT
jgi:hypothetical protein